MVTALTILCLVSVIIGFNSTEKSFSLYALYTFFLLFYFILISPYDFKWRDQLYATPYKALRWYSQVIYNCSYFLFFLYFLDVKKHLNTFYRFIVKVVFILFLVGTLAFIYSILFKNPGFFDFFYIYIFVPILFFFAIYALIKSFGLPGKLKYFFITGGSVFICFAMIALFFPIMGWQIFGVEAFVMFYIAIFIEQFVFAIGLAYKVKTINQKMLNKSLENQQIEERQNELLEVKLKEKENELLAITAKAEKEKISRLRSTFEDQIHHLHLAALQNQMNPHFIFNALNSIKVFLIDNEKEKAIYYLNKFSKLIRNILESSRGESITLDEEIKILKLYVNIENIRFEDDIKFSIENPENLNLASINLPPMILQPFIENAIWHGLMLKKGEKQIRITFFESADNIFMKIRDNGIGRQKSQKKGGKRFFQKKSVGLQLISERLKYFNQKKDLSYSFEIIDLKDDFDKPLGTEIEFSFQT